MFSCFVFCFIQFYLIVSSQAAFSMVRVYVMVMRKGVPIVPRTSRGSNFPFFGTAIRNFVTAVPFANVRYVVTNFLGNFACRHIQVQSYYSLFFRIVGVFSNR